MTRKDLIERLCPHILITPPIQDGALTMEGNHLVEYLVALEDVARKWFELDGMTYRDAESGRFVDGVYIPDKVDPEKPEE